MEINQNAPIKAESEIAIHAPANVVWELLSDISRWPMWLHDVSDASITEELTKGTEFTWKNKGIKIRSVIQHVQPMQELAWTGRVFGVSANDTWHLRSNGDHSTIVRTAESMEGFIARFIFSSGKLKQSLDNWLQDLKSACESL